MRIASFVFFVLLFGCVPIEEEDVQGRGVITKEFNLGDCNSYVAKGMGNAQVLNHDGVVYEYYVYLPDDYDPCRPFPVILNFHGGDQTADEFRNNAFMSEFQVKADEEDIILVWVDSAVLPIGLWNNNLGRSPSRDHVGMVETLLNELESEFSINDEKMHLLGYSEGAIFAQYLSLQLPGIFSSVVAVSGITGEFYATNLFGSPNANDPYLFFNRFLAFGPYEALSIWPDHKFPTSSATPVLMVRGLVDGVFPTHGAAGIVLTIQPFGNVFTFPIYNLTEPNFSDFKGWSKSLACTGIPRVPIMVGATRIGWKHECVGGAADMYIEVFDTVAHAMPAVSNTGIDGPGRVMNFILAHQ